MLWWFRFLGTAALLAGSSWTATLERLSLDAMILQSTQIVRGRATRAWSAPRGSVVYTHHAIAVTETLKGTSRPEVHVAIPGGTAGRLRQRFAGAPDVVPGQEYVFFLWTGRSGIPQVIGLSQGLLRLARDARGELIAGRSAVSDTMLDAETGQPVVDRGLSITLPQLRARVRELVGGLQ